MVMTLNGVGIGLRREHFDAILATERRIDWLEIIPENFMANGGRGTRTLLDCQQRWAIGAHGVALSLGGPDPLNADYLDALGRLLDRLEVDEFTEHLCYAVAGGINFNDLLPLPFTSEAVEHVAGRVRRVREVLGRPVSLENVSYYAEMPGAEMSEAEFITAVLSEADCGLLLDVNNVFVNAFNRGTDALDDLLALPLHRTTRIHIAGHKYRDDFAVDNHGSPVCEAVFALYREALSRTGPVPTLLERDMNIPPLDDVLDEADCVRAIYDEVVGS